MYNEKFKEKFLSEYRVQNFRNTIHSIFLTAERFEKQNGKDLAFFTKEEAVNFLNSRLTCNVLTVKREANFLRSYQAWAHEQSSGVLIEMAGGVHETNQAASIKKEDLDLAGCIKRNIIFDSQELMKEITSGTTLDKGYYSVAALCCAWIGLPVSEAVSLPKEDVDLRMGTIHRNNGTVVSIQDDNVLAALRLYQNISVSYRTQNRTFEVYPQESPYFLRVMVTKNSKKSPKSISSKAAALEIQRLNKAVVSKLGYSKLDYTDVYRSGQLHRAYVLEQDGIDILSKENRPLFHSLFDNRGDYYDYVYLYKQYKKAFNLL